MYDLDVCGRSVLLFLCPNESTELGMMYVCVFPSWGCVFCLQLRPWETKHPPLLEHAEIAEAVSIQSEWPFCLTFFWLDAFLIPSVSPSVSGAIAGANFVGFGTQQGRIPGDLEAKELIS